MHQLQAQMNRAMHSGLQLWLLNYFLLRKVPFNKPHGLTVSRITSEGLRISADTRKRNRNHIQGIHACLLATLCEYTSGLALLRLLDPAHYRIILKGIHMDYFFQAKKEVWAQLELKQDWFCREILEPLHAQQVLFKEFKISVYDIDHTLVCSGLVHWQIKDWKQVRTRL